MTILIDKRGVYPTRSFAPVARIAWTKFFGLDTSRFDIAHWFIEANSATVRLTGRVSTVDEADPAWDTPTPIVMLVDGTIEAFDSQDPETVQREFRQWAEEGILTSLNSKGLSKQSDQILAKHDGFTVASATSDLGLAEDDLKIIWRAGKSLSVAQIRRRQATAQQATPRRSVVKKRSRK